MAQSVPFRKARVRPALCLSPLRHVPYHPGMANSHAELVGARIRAARLRRKRDGLAWTQEWLAERVGVERRTIGNYETGDREPDLERLGQLAEALACDPLWLGAIDQGRKLDRREEALLRLFRSSDARGKDLIYRIAESQPSYLEPGALDEAANGR